MDEDLPPGWAWATLGEVGIVSGGLTKNPKRETAAVKVPFLRVANVQSGRLDLRDIRKIGVEESELPHAFLHPGDLLIVEGNGSIEQVGRCAVWRGAIRDCAHQNHIIRVRLSIDVLPEFASHWLSSIKGRSLIEDVASSTSGLHTLSISKVQQLRLPIAPLAEQERIVAAINDQFTDLDTADAALGRAREGVEQFRASLLHAACTGALTAAWREANPTTETGADLLRRILAERRATWERIEHARLTAKGTPPKGDAWKVRYVEPPEVANPASFGLPDGWSLAPLAHLVVEGPTNGYSPKASTDGTGTLALKLTATTRGRIELGPKAIKQLGETIPAGSNLFLRSGDLLFQRGNTPEYVGISAIYEGPPDTYIYPDLLIRVRLSDSKLVRWIWRVANAPSGRKYMQNDASGTAGTMPKITGTTIRNLPVPIPPTAELEQLHSLIDEGEDATLSATAYLDTATLALNNLRQSILHAAFTGRLVPQDPTDEPAAALLGRLRAAPTPARRPRCRPVREKASA